MADEIKIADLPSAATISSTDYLIVEQEEYTAKSTVSQLTTDLGLLTSEGLGQTTTAAKLGTSDGSNVQSNLDTLSSEISALESDVSGFQSDIDNVKNTVSTLETNVTNAQTAVSNMQTTVDNMQTTVTNVDNDMADVKSDIATVQSDVADVKTQVGTFETELNKKQPLETKLTSLSAINGTINTLPYFSSARTFAETALSETSRTLLAKTTYDDLRSELSLYTKDQVDTLIAANGGGSSENASYVLLSTTTNPALGSRTVFDNPFGNSTPVICIPEINHSNLGWITTPWTYFTSSNIIGARAAYVEGEGIVLRIAGNGFVANAAYSGASKAISTTYNTLSQFRIHVFKVSA